MAKKRPPKKQILSIQGFDTEHLRQTNEYMKMIDAIYNNAVADFAKIADRLNVNTDKPFAFKDYPTAKNKVNEIISQLSNNLKTVVYQGSRKQWLYANEKNDAFLESIFDTTKIKKTTLAKYQDRNLEALKTFQTRKTNGLDLSERIFNYSGQMKTQMEMAIDLAIGDGLSAQSLSRELKQYLVDPDKLFRRVRDKHGVLQLSKNAQAFNPGQGKYRSSHKNAMRLARTEINMAYRESDHLRWKQLDFVTGFEVKLSNSHKIYDICDILKGNYPKNFKFIGWHPQCYSDDTEVMTNFGWKLFKDLLKDDLIMSLNPETRQPEYVKYAEYVEYHREGDMVRFSNKSLDMLVTPDHKMVYLGKQKGDIRENKLAQDYSKNHGGLYRSSEYRFPDVRKTMIGNYEIDFNVFAEFMAYYLADGSLSHTRKNQLYISQTKTHDPETYSKIELCLSKMPFKYTPLSDKFYIRDADLYEYLKQFGKSIDKHVPDEIKNSSPNQIKIFLDAYISCDGHVRKSKPFIGNKGTMFKSDKDERVYFTSSDQMASDLGELLLKIGHRPSYNLQKTKGIEVKHNNGTYTGNKDLWRVSECYSKTSTVFNKEIVQYSGMVYDVQLEKNHILYVRRNGKCVWGSNCMCHAIPILLSPEEFDKDELSELRSAINGTEYKPFQSPNTITEMPKGFKDWVKENAERSQGWKSQPYWIKDNFSGGKLSGGLDI